MQILKKTKDNFKIISLVIKFKNLSSFFEVKHRFANFFEVVFWVCFNTLEMWVNNDAKLLNLICNLFLSILDGCCFFFKFFDIGGNLEIAWHYVVHYD